MAWQQLDELETSMQNIILRIEKVFSKQIESKLSEQTFEKNSTKTKI